jgi:6,7-dimethyl-8-ribityllumazine synthase
VDLSKTQPEIPESKDVKVEILLPYFNDSLGLELLENVIETLTKHNVSEENITTTRVAGTLELPFAAQARIKSTSPAVVIALGVVIKGETSHYDQVCNETYRGLMDVQLSLETPIIFGVLTCDNEDQAKNRSSKDGLNKGKSFAEAALIQAKIKQ